eukprot:scaffold210390_cov34-Tisochrysis_lutea.AAC.1
MDAILLDVISNLLCNCPFPLLCRLGLSASAELERASVESDRIEYRPSKTGEHREHLPTAGHRTRLEKKPAWA